MFNVDSLVRDNIKNMNPYSSAREEYAEDEGIFLDANENPFGTLNRYPDPHQHKLKALISSIKKVARNNLILGNGSDEIIDLLFKVFCRPGYDKVIIFTPTYGMYKVSAQINNNQIIDIPLNEKFGINRKKLAPYLSNEDIKLTFLCSPNNPTGNLIHKEDVEFILHHTPGLVVIDEAYIDFIESPSWTHLLSGYPNLIVMQTLSKAWALAGIRIGMAMASTKIIDYLNRVKPPYNISTPNQLAAIQALSDMNTFKYNRQQIMDEKEKLRKGLLNSPLINKIYPSSANFWLVEVTDANIIYNLLIDKKLIIRNRNNVIKNCLRITIGTEAENNALIKGLKEIENEKSIISR